MPFGSNLDFIRRFPYVSTQISENKLLKLERPRSSAEDQVPGNVVAVNRAADLKSVLSLFDFQEPADGKTVTRCCSLCQEKPSRFVSR